MIKWKTKFVNTIGSISFPIYLLILPNGKYDLECEHEIYALAWHDIYTESIAEYKLATVQSTTPNDRSE